MRTSQPADRAEEVGPIMTGPRSLLFMVLLALAVGVVAGFGAWGFRLLIGLIHNLLFQGTLDAAYDANRHTPTSFWGVGVVLVPVAGAVVVAWLVKNFAPEAKGHGVPEVMDAIYYNQGRIRPRVAIVKSLASAISIGSGGSVGREGPIVQIGSAFGSTLGTLIPMRPGDRAALIAAGAGAGIAATFNAPLGGIVFAIELLLVSVNARNVLLVTLAAVLATHIGRMLIGTAPSFYVPALEIPDLTLLQPVGLATFPILGLLMGLVSVAFIRGLYRTEDLFEAMPGNYYTRHMLGMLGVGVMMYLLWRQTGHYWVEGVGYATIMDILQGALSSPWFLLMLAALKLLATFLSLGSGASGGVFSPALFVGAAGGAAFGQLCHALLPGLDVSIPTFAIAGMAASVAGSTGAVLTGIVMLTEMTRDYSIILPLAITCAVAYAVRRAIMDDSIYTMKLRARRHTVPQGLDSSRLTSRCVRDMATTDFAVVPAGGAVPGDVPFIVHTEGDAITGVSQQEPRLPEAAEAGRPRRPMQPVPVSEQATPISAARALLGTEGGIILVSRRPGSGRAEDLIGIVSPAALAHLLGTVEDLS